MLPAPDRPDASGQEPYEDTSTEGEPGAKERTSGPLIIGVGASAGGVEALKRFFEGLPETANPLAFIVVVHLPAHSPSHLVSILQDATSRSVEAAEDGAGVKGGRIYVAPPGKRIRLEGDVLHVDEAQSPHDATTVDQLFRSIAANRRGDCAGIVLSGTGTDGTLGIRSIKEAAGLVLVQSPEDAGHDGMPRSAIETALVDVVAPAAQLAERLIQAVETGAKLGTLTSARPDAEVERLLERVFARVQSTTGHNFASYRRSTIVRRLQRRMQVRSCENLAAYLDLLSVDSDEVRALEREFLITVTSFFRDPDAFAALEETVIPAVFDHAPDGEGVRVWVAGCATGEEAYSVAMLLLEEAERRSSARDVQVFATDIDADAVETAREGIYPGTIRADVSEPRVDRFFDADENHLRVVPELREAVLFAHHDLLSDPPFSNVDLVTCRNLLIYLNPDMQERVFQTLHYSLREPGFLFLGRSEAASRAAELFKPVDSSANIYEARGQGPESIRRMIQGRTMRETGSEWMKHPTFPSPNRRTSFGVRVHGRALMEEVASVLVRKDRSIVHLSDAASRYLKYRSGTPMLPGAVPEAIRGPVETGLRRAFDDEARTAHQASGVEVGDDVVDLTVTVRPVVDRESSEPLAIVCFQPRFTAPAAAASAKADPPRGVEPETAPETEPETERETESEVEADGRRPDPRRDDGDGAQEGTRKKLFETQERLRTVTEEYETTREEMEAANEELLSMNEELQSKNEELETSREELQSVNEELDATNQQLQAKLQDLGEANNVLENLMASTDIATLFLDTDLKIRRFTPRTTELFSLRKQDVGRPIADFTQRFDYDGLLEDARRVLRELTTIEREISQDDDHWFLVRVRPFRTVDNRIDGVVITFVEITNRKQAEEALRKSERFHRMAVEASGVGTWDADLETGDWRLSKRMAELLGYDAPRSARSVDHARSVSNDGDPFLTVVPHQIAISNEEWMAAVHPDDRPVVERALQQSRDTGQPFDLTFRILPPDGGTDGEEVRWLYSRGDRVTTDNRRHLHGASLDVTEERRLEREIVQSGEEIRHRIGQDLHDVLSSGLASVAVRMENLKTRLQHGGTGEGDPETAAQTMADLAEKIRDAVGQARSLAYSLIPAALQERRLPDALEALCKEEARVSGVSCTFEGGLGDASPDQESAVHLYRIAREAITNARQHANADAVTVHLTHEDGRVVLTVRDDGTGPPPEGFSDGLGVRLMRYRADLIGASFRIGSAEGGGTIVRCELPIAAPDRTESDG